MRTALFDVAAELQRASDVWASAEASILTAVSTDYGGIIRKVPAVAARPANTAQVAAVLRYANRHGIAVTVRGAGHSIGGQTLSEGGIVLDARYLSRVWTPNLEESSIDAEPGAKWRSVVDRALTSGVVPPVLTGTLGTSVGGTHSVGGMGHASHLYGAQIDHCQGLEVVTPDGEIRWCDEHTHSELFEHVLGGLGQLGVITRVRHRVRTYRPLVQRWHFYYTRLGRMLRDLEVLALAGVADYLAGHGFNVNGRLGYAIDLVFEVDPARDAARVAAMRAIEPVVVRGPDTESFEAYMRRQPLPDDRDGRLPANGKINAWIDGLLPAAHTSAVFDDILGQLPSSLRRRVSLLFWPLFRRHFTRPLFMLPDSEQIYMGGIYLTVPESESRTALSAVAAATERIAMAGGKRYVYAWLPFDSAAWADHYGAHWPTLCRLKARWDPHGILNRDIIQYESAPVANTPLDCWNKAIT